MVAPSPRRYDVAVRRRPRSGAPCYRRSRTLRSAAGIPFAYLPAEKLAAGPDSALIHSVQGNCARGLSEFCIQSSMPFMVEIERPQRRAVGQWVLEQLYSDIFSGRLPTGAEVGEIELSTRLGVSRSPVRDALRQLEFDGLVVEGAKNGLRVVRGFTTQDIAELYDVRAALEALAFEVAARSVTDEDLHRLQTINAEMDAAESASPAGDGRDYGHDVAFHREVCRITNMPRLRRTLDGILRETRALLRHVDLVGAYPDSPAEVKEAHQEHWDLLEKLRQRDPEGARSLLIRHLQDRRDTLLRSVSALGLMQ